ncbi:hypothetical protein [Stieleria varia]|uniref:Ribonuclease HIII n=1 Tax=Stieleria varia TaxID=2528005 RepID=A0A5C6AYM6_9BACT|nr:hypothetical protein [Stieleria varia]TWU04232.1 hypothetical protein Pla52n_22710 [Stieleria varia]
MGAYLIATDEAGYGPKLGPLVVAATAWHVDSQVLSDCTLQGSLEDAFALLRHPVMHQGVKLVIDDSKAVYRPRSSGPEGGSLSKLTAAVGIAMNWVSDSPSLQVTQWIDSSDRRDIDATDWLGESCFEMHAESSVAVPEPWRTSSVRLFNVATRVITAGRFNQMIASGMNKSDVLSDATLGLVRQLLPKQSSESPLPADDPIIVYCDRHGGRRYYASVLQHVFGGELVRVMSESKHVSAYSVPYQGREFRICFTVKGDRFTPVAYSSMIAKYLRERAMESFNAYFAEYHTGKQPLLPTAGYPVDADRFLEDVAAIIKRRKIKPVDLVRVR